MPRTFIGDRTPEEERYDGEVIRCLREGKNIKKALAKANEKYPSEALQVDTESLADVQAHYEYLAQNEEMVLKLRMIK